MGNESVSILLGQKWGDGRVDKRPGMQARTLAGSSLCLQATHPQRPRSGPFRSSVLRRLSNVLTELQPVLAEWKSSLQAPAAPEVLGGQDQAYGHCSWWCLGVNKNEISLCDDWWQVF